MKLEIIKRKDGVNESFYEILEGCISEYNSPSKVADFILFDCKISDLSKILQILLENIEDLQHFKNSITGLYATDNLEFINDNKDKLFEIKFNLKQQ